MRSETTGSERAQESPAAIDQMSLRRLIEALAHQQSIVAWCEFVANRTPFRNGSAFVPLLEFVQSEAEHQSRRYAGTYARLEEVCDIAMDRLGPPVDASRVPPYRRNATPPYAHRWSALTSTIELAAQTECWTDGLSEELRVAEIAQGFVRQQVAFAVREVRRSCNPARSRYRWRTASAVLHLWMPRDVTGRVRRRWLIANALGNEAASVPDRQRVQAAIDSHFGTRRHERLGDHLPDRAIEVHDDPALILARKQLAECRLSTVVAREKADNLPQQRQAIRALGPARLEQLVLTIFDALAAGRFREREVARQFGLSASTLSRFAGVRWSVGSSRTIPDLWANLAQVVAGDAMFKECAESAGVWPQVEQTADSAKQSR